MKYSVREPIFGAVVAGRRATVITIPADSVIEVMGNLLSLSLVEVRWREGHARVFTQDIIDCCEPLQEPGLADSR